MYQADGRSGLGCSPPAHGSLRRCSAPRGSPCSSQDGDGHVEGSGPGHSGRSQDTARSSDVGEGWGKCAQTQQAARLHPSGDSAENVVRPLMSSERQRLRELPGHGSDGVSFSPCTLSRPLPSGELVLVGGFSASLTAGGCRSPGLLVGTMFNATHTGGVAWTPSHVPSFRVACHSPTTRGAVLPAPSNPGGPVILGP